MENNVDSPSARDPQRPLQFTLRALLILMTLISLALGVAVWRGLGTLPHSLGMLWAWLNASGRLQSLQTPTARPRIFLIGWLLVGVSLVLPAAKGCNNQEILGWRAAQACVLAEARILAAPFQLHDEGDDANKVFTFEALFFTMLNLANLGLLMSPFFFWRLQRERGHWFGNVLAVAAVTAWFCSWEQSSGFLIGFYVWCLAFAVLLTAYRVRWPTFLCMVAWSAVLIGRVMLEA